MSVLDPPPSLPSIVGLYGIEIEKSVRCHCGHRMVQPNTIQHWYWQEHSVSRCTLELPDLVCWCGLKRSEHVDGHREGAR